MKKTHHKYFFNNSRKIVSTGLVLMVFVLLTSCNKGRILYPEPEPQPEEEKAPPAIFLAVPEGGFDVAAGDTLLLNAYIENGKKTELLWTVNGETAGKEQTLLFREISLGTYPVSLQAVNKDGSDNVQFQVHVKNPEDMPEDGENNPEIPPSGNHFRPATKESAVDWNVVFSYIPAPGQFINNTQTAGFAGESTPEQAALYAHKRLAKGHFVSLGAFGGHLIVGFDHSVVNDGEYNLLIAGNAHEQSAEPGTIWVMQDSNGNGLPDDTWYQLKGSEHHNPATLHGYAVTYFRPRQPNKPVYWTDNKGGQGSIDYIVGVHTQETYYPGWIASEYYTLTGTRLESRSYRQPNGIWENHPFDWGYVDNTEQELFRISDAVTASGDPIHLDFIDFVKIQTAVQAKAGWLGELSTEVTKIQDYNLIK